MPLDNLSNTMRIFLGARMECAQCHDDPFGTTERHDFYQLAAFTHGQEPLRQELMTPLWNELRDGPRANSEEMRVARILWDGVYGMSLGGSASGPLKPDQMFYNTSFQFDIAGLSFASTSYEWLVVQGTSASATKTAQYKGAGQLTIGGVLQPGSYGFMLWAQDGTPDSFRIMITDPSGVTVYDNKVNELTGAEFGTAITGGSIIVHIPKK